MRSIQGYFSEELKQRIGQFDAEFLLDFVGREIGAYFYNRGLYDAQAILGRKMDDLQDAILQLEQPTGLSRSRPARMPGIRRPPLGPPCAAT